MRSRELNQNLNLRTGFTLTELLVVILLLGIMLAVGLPALLNLASSSKLEAAANEVHSTVKLAWQHALTQGQPTYIVFHDAHSATGNVRHLAYRAYAVFAIDIHTNAVTQAAGYFLTDWKTLPEGVVFDAADAQDPHHVFNVSGEAWDGGFNRNHRLYIEPSTYVALGFNPRRISPDMTDIYLSDGFYDETGRQVATSAQRKRIRVWGTGKSAVSSVPAKKEGSAASL